MAATFETNFQAGPEQVKGWKQTAGSLTYGQEGAEFVINKQGDAPTIQSETYLHFGYVEVKAKASWGTGIISSIVLQSEDLDEVDWEFIGGRPGVVQTNYFGKGNTTTYDRMIEVPVQETQTRMHTYSIDWTAERIVFAVDGAPVRTLNYADANGGKNYPQTPSTVRIGIWAGGDPTNEQGVIEWAGGKTDYTKAPFKMVVESVRVRNYSPGKEYEWTDRSGSWESIKVIGEGDQAGAPENTKPLEPTASATGDGLASGIDVPTGSDSVPSGTVGMPVGTGYPIGTGVGSLPSASCTGSVIPPYPTGLNSTAPAGENPPYVPGPTAPAEYPSTFLSSTYALPSTGGAVPPPAGTGIASSPPFNPSPSPSGLNVDTEPAPSVPFPTGGASVSAPSGSDDVVEATPTPSEFDGAASTVKVGAFAAVAAAAAAILFV